MEHNLSGEGIIQILNSEQKNLVDKYDIIRIGLFGSYLHDNYSENSDIDILVDFSNPTFDKYMDLKFHLEDLFHKKVDLVIYENIKPRLKNHIWIFTHSLMTTKQLMLL